MIRMVAADALTDRGIMAWEAGDADEALEVLGQHPRIGVVFTDVNMPGELDGLELARVVHERWPEIRLLIASGQVFPKPEELPDSGQFVPKPWEPSAVVRRIQAMIGRAA